jgi:hypothetical protein
LVYWCRLEIEKLESKEARQAVVSVLSMNATDVLTGPWPKLAVLTKHQATLDNQLYKGTKALRDEQAWRMSLGSVV